MGFGVGYLGLAWNQPALVALGFAGGILHILNHALFKCLLFYAAGAVYRATHTVDLERLGGLAAPHAAGPARFFLLGGLAISALPPFNGFVSEFLIYAGLLERGGAGRDRARASSSRSPRCSPSSAASRALSMTRAFGLAFLGDAARRHRPLRGRGRRATCRSRWRSTPLGGRARRLRACGGARRGRPAGAALPGARRPWRRRAPRRSALVRARRADRAGRPARRSRRCSSRAAGCRRGERRAAPRDLGLRLHGADAAHAVHRHLVLGAARASSFEPVLASPPARAAARAGRSPSAARHARARTCVDAVERRMFEVLGRGRGLRAASASGRIPERAALLASPPGSSCSSRSIGPARRAGGDPVSASLIIAARRGAAAPPDPARRDRSTGPRRGGPGGRARRILQTRLGPAAAPPEERRSTATSRRRSSGSGRSSLLATHRCVSGCVVPLLGGCAPFSFPFDFVSSPTSGGSAAWP